MTPLVRAYIDLPALQHNYTIVRQHAPESKVIAMIKSRAYGHGLVEVAGALPDVDAFGVARIEEGIALRKMGIQKPLVVMSGFTYEDEMPIYKEHNLTAVVHCDSQLDFFGRLPKVPFPVWLKVDTGMHRLGIPVGKTKDAFARTKPEVVLTHLSKADEENSNYTERQLLMFEQAVGDLSVEFSIANSAAILAYPKTHSDWVRPGIMLYGVSPFLKKTGEAFNLKPVMTLKSKIISIKKLKKGDEIGYGGIYTCPKDMTIAVVAVGYGDGYPRHAKSGTPVLIHNKRCELVGRVSMDLITVNVDNCPTAKVGDEVVLWGRGLPAEEVAHCADTIPYQLLCDVSSRVAFIYE